MKERGQPDFYFVTLGESIKAIALLINQKNLPKPQEFLISKEN